MAERIVVDPITRIEGHLRIEAEMDGEVIRNAYSSGTMVRGIEIILKGRDPRDAWAYTQRICGVCTLVHALCSVRAVEDALEIDVPPNADLIRNLMSAAQHVHDHVMHFYHLHALDWVDVVAALKADPKQTSALAQSISPYPKSSPGYFAEVRARVAAFVESGQLGIFAHGYWGHPAYRLPPEANLMALAHYLEALTWQRDVVKLHTIFGGRNPHPNFVVGGVPCAISVDSGGQAGTALDMVGLAQVGEVIASMRTFVDQVYLPDLLTIASYYKEWARQGEGVGNFLCYGDFPDNGIRNPESYLVPGGVIVDRDLSAVQPLNLCDPAQVQELITHSWYDYAAGKETALHPYDGETTLHYTGPEPPYDHLDVAQGYSWIKSPRWRGRPMEVGPLARMLMLYATGNAQARELVDSALTQLDLPQAALFSTLGRTTARGLETKLFADAMSGWYDRLLANIKGGDLTTFNGDRWEPATWPDRCRGVGFMEAPRGGLAHWLSIEDGRIANYQAVVPSTWNAGPRDAKGQPGPYEAALAGHRLHDPKQPIEILRTIHSFDPCIACAVHVSDPELGELVEVKIQ